MDIYDIPNIEHCDVSPIGTSGWRVFAHEGWYIHKPTDLPGVDADGNPTIIYRTVAIIRNTENLAGIEIIAEADLPENAEICGDTGNNQEVM